MVRGVITASIKQSGQTREQIADRMSFLLNLQVTARMITSFTAESKELHRWPGAWDRAFCAAVGDNTLLLCRVKAANFVVVEGTDVQLLELGREYLRQKRAAARMESLEIGLVGVEL